MSDVQLLRQFSGEGVDTLIVMRLEELIPHLYFTFSFPILWCGDNEADFRIRVISVETGAILNDVRLRRSTGGPFNIRPAHWSGDDLREAHRDIINVRQ